MGYITVNIMQKSSLSRNQVVKRGSGYVEYHVGSEGFDPRRREDRDRLAGKISGTGISVNTNCREWESGLRFGENKIPD